MKRQFGFLKTTAIGGAIFLLPLIVIGALLAQIVPIVLWIANIWAEWIPIDTPAGIALVLLLAIAVLVILCFVAGLVARRSLGRQFSRAAEKYLLLCFPKYAIIREQMAGSVGGNEHKPRLDPVVVQLDDRSMIAFEVDRKGGDTESSAGTVGGTVAVYVPGSPDPWAGSIIYVEAERVERLDIEYGDAMAVFEQLGRGSAQLISQASES